MFTNIDVAPLAYWNVKKKKKTNLENVIHFTGARNIVTVKWTHFKVDYISKGEYEWKTAGQFHIVGSYWLLHFIMCSAVRGAEPLFSPIHYTFTWHHYALRSCMNNIPVSVICFWGNLGEKKKKKKEMQQLIIEFLNVFGGKKVRTLN